MSAALFPAISGTSDPRWGQAIRSGRAAGNAALEQIRKRLSRQGDDTAHAQRSSETLRRPDANKFTQGSSVVEQETHTLHVAGSIPAPASNLPPACGSATNGTGGGLSASAGVKVIESVGPARGRFGADECMPITHTNRASAEAATVANAAPNSGAPCHAPESILTVVGSAVPGQERAHGRAEAGEGAIVEDLIRRLRTPSGWWNGDVHARRVLTELLAHMRAQQLSRGSDALSVSLLDEQGAHAAAGSISKPHDHG